MCVSILTLLSLRLVQAEDPPVSIGHMHMIEDILKLDYIFFIEDMLDYYETG